MQKCILNVNCMILKIFGGQTNLSFFQLPNEVELLYGAGVLGIKVCYFDASKDEIAKERPNCSVNHNKISDVKGENKFVVDV